MEVIDFKVFLKSGCYNFFCELGNEGLVGDRSIVLINIRIKGRLLKEWFDQTMLKCSREHTGRQRLIDDVGNCWAERIQILCF